MGILVSVISLYEMIIFMRIILSWVPMDKTHFVIEWITKLTDPVMVPARTIYMSAIEKLNINIPLDLSPILVLVLLRFLKSTLISIF